MLKSITPALKAGAPRPSWADKLGLLGHGTKAESVLAAKAPGAWNKRIADLIIGKR